MTPRVSVVGSVNMDLVVMVPRLPEPGQTVSGSAVEHRAGGKGANQASGAAAMGAEVAFVGSVGDDTFGRTLNDNLRSRGVDVTGVFVRTGETTGVALVVVDDRGQNTITVAPGANAALTEEQASDVPDGDILLLQLEIATRLNLVAADRARDRQMTTVLNAAPLPDPVSDEIAKLIALCEVLVVNEGEATQLLGAGVTTWEQAALDLVALGPKAAVITLGADGAVAAVADQVFVQSAFPVTAVDGTGAGDNFCGALAVALAERAPWPDALIRACAAGAIATTRLGAQESVPTADEVAAMIAKGRSHAS